MKRITWYEVRRQTGERDWTVLGNYESEEVAKAVAEAGKGAGWYGANDTYHAAGVLISEAPNAEEAEKERVKNSPEYKEYQRLKKRFKKFEEALDTEPEPGSVEPVPEEPVRPPKPPKKRPQVIGPRRSGIVSR